MRESGGDDGTEEIFFCIVRSGKMSQSFARGTDVND